MKNLTVPLAALALLVSAAAGARGAGPALSIDWYPDGACADVEAPNPGDPAGCRTGVVERDCDDGVDGDSDERTDCADSDCASAPNCAPYVRRPEACGNAIDDDLDGQVDCADSECYSHATCACSNDWWNVWQPACSSCAISELDADGNCSPDANDPCADRADPEGDALTDCEDDECLADPACVGAAAQDANLGGDPAAAGAVVGGHLGATADPAAAGAAGGYTYDYADTGTAKDGTEPTGGYCGDDVCDPDEKGWCPDCLDRLCAVDGVYLPSNECHAHANKFCDESAGSDARVVQCGSPYVDGSAGSVTDILGGAHDKSLPPPYRAGRQPLVPHRAAERREVLLHGLRLLGRRYLALGRRWRRVRPAALLRSVPAKPVQCARRRRAGADDERRGCRVRSAGGRRVRGLLPETVRRRMGRFGPVRCGRRKRVRCVG